MSNVPAWRMQGPGAPEVLELSVYRLEKPTGQQVLIRVEAAGFNPIDTKIRAGIAAIAPESGVLGVDVSGIIEAVGDDVSGFRPGDAVYGCAGGVRGHAGALAQYMLADARLLAKAPKSIPLAQAAGLPVPSLTALALRRRLNLQSQDELCVLGGSGAVGQMVIQLARQTGCRVVGSAGSDARLELIRQAGAQACLHHEVSALARSFPKVVDTFGGSALQQALALAAAGGQVATINARGQHELGLAHAKNLTLHAIFILLPLLNDAGREGLGRDLTEIATAIDRGTIRPLPVTVVPMSQVVDVHRQYEAGLLQKKTVLLADF